MLFFPYFTFCYKFSSVQTCYSLQIMLSKISIVGYKRQERLGAVHHWTHVDAALMDPDGRTPAYLWH
jgi:hypothetical protein